MRNELIFGFLFEFWCKVVLYLFVSLGFLFFWGVYRGFEILRVFFRRVGI